MKIKQVRRWKKQTVAEQAGIARRFSGRLLWAVLLLGGIGGLVSSACPRKPAAGTHLLLFWKRQMPG
ncbi:MAG: hypothetical protein ACLRYD_03920 [Ruminococcus callidus]